MIERIMCALTFNRKRRDYSFNSDIQSYAHVTKKPKVSAPSMADYSPPSSSSKLSAYSDRKPRLSRMPHAPVRNSKFSFFNFRKRIFGLQLNFAAVKDATLGSLRHFKKEDEVFVEKEKAGEVEVIQIDDSEDEEIVSVEKDEANEVVEIDDSEEDDRLDVSDYFYIEQSDVLEDKEFRSKDSQVVSDVRSVAEKIDVGNESQARFGGSSGRRGNVFELASGSLGHFEKGKGKEVIQIDDGGEERLDESDYLSIEQSDVSEHMDVDISPVVWGVSNSVEKIGGSNKSQTRDGDLSGRLGNVLGLALGSLRFLKKEAELLLGKYKRKEEIHIDDSEDEVKRVDISDHSKIEQSDGVVMELDKEFRSLGSVVSDVSNVVEKMDGRDKDYRKLYESAKKRGCNLKRVQSGMELLKKRCEGFLLLLSQFKSMEVKKDTAEECFAALTMEEEKEVDDVLDPRKSFKILLSHQNSSIDITLETLQCLKPQRWLNDEVINVYLELLKEREKRVRNKFLKCHFFNTFFYNKLISRGGYNYQQVRRWTSHRKLGYSLSDCDKIFVPIHQNRNHWCLAIINNKEKKFQYLDSLGGFDPRVLDVLCRYYIDEVKEKNGKEVDVSTWQLEYVRDLPVQENGFDCGMFMIKYADFYSRGLGLCFGQEHMPYFRRRTVKELLRLRAE